MTFRARLLVVFGYLVAVVTLALEVPLALNVQSRTESELRSQVLGNAAVLAARVAEPVASASSVPGARDRVTAIVDETARAADVRILITDATGGVLADSEGLAIPGEQYATADRPELGEALFRGQIDSRRRFSDTLQQELLLVTVPVVDGGRVVGAARVSADTSTIAAVVRDSWLRLALIGAAVLAVAMALAWVLAGTLARPVRDLAASAAQIGRGELGARASVQGPAEIAALARSFNSMADALAANVRAQSDFLANASHQLRTPLTGLRLRIEGIRAEGGAVGDEAAKAEREVDRLNKLVEDLLSLARASSVDASAVSVDLAIAARDAAERWRKPFDAQGKPLKLGELAPARVWASPRDVANILDNLIENALRYSPPDADVTIETRSRGGLSVLAVANSGPGINLQDRARVFERFYRGSAGREAGGGTGLGLAIVAELAQRWQGDVRLADGPGTRFEASFPAAEQILNRSLGKPLPGR